MKNLKKMYIYMYRHMVCDDVLDVQKGVFQYLVQENLKTAEYLI